MAAAFVSASQHSSSSCVSSSHWSAGASRRFALLQLDTRWKTVASWPLKRNIDCPKTSKIRTKSPAPRTAKPNPDPKPKLQTSKLLDRRCHGIAGIYIILQRISASNMNIGTVESLNCNCQTWLPAAPKLSKPRSIYNAACLAYLGDCVYELYVRRHFLFPPLSINEYNSRVMALVCCEAQNALLQELLKDNFLSEEERDVIRWGRNIESGKTRTVRRAGIAVYNRASSLETLVGYLYLTNANRLEVVMEKMGFCTGFPAQPTFERTN